MLSSLSPCPSPCVNYNVTFCLITILHLSLLLHWITEEEQSTRSLVLPYDQYHSPLSLSQVYRVLCRLPPSSPNNNILIIVLISRHAPKEILSSNRSLLQQFLYLFYHSWLILLLSLSSSPSLFTSAVQNQSYLCRGVYHIIIICYQSLLSPLGSQHPSLLSNLYNSTSLLLLIASSRCPCIVNNIINGGSELQSSSLRGFTSGSIVSSFFLVYYSHDPTCIICVCVFVCNYHFFFFCWAAFVCGWPKSAILYRT